MKSLKIILITGGLLVSQLSSADTDVGVLGSGINKYFGEKYEIEFFDNNTAMLTPLSDDQALTNSEVLNCEL